MLHYKNDSNLILNKSTLDILIIGVLIIGNRVANISVIMYILLAYLIFKVIRNDLNYFFYATLILMPNMGVIFAPGLPIPLINILAMVSLIVFGIREKRLVINKHFMLISFVLIMYEWIHVILYDIGSFLSLITWTTIIVYIAIFISNKKDIYNHKLAIKYFVSGTIISSIYGIYNRVMTVGINFISRNVNDRFNGAAGDANYYSMYILVAVFSLLVLVNKENSFIKKVMYAITFTFLTFMGFMSLSRMYSIILILLMGIYFLANIVSIQKYKKQRQFILILIITFMFIFIIAKEPIMNNIGIIVSRFESNLNNTTMLFSNRDIILEKYISYWKENPISTILGVGIQKYNIRVGTSYAHNIIVELIASLGILGTILFIAYLIYIHIKEKHSNIYIKDRLINWIPLFAIAISFLSINSIEVEAFYILYIYTIKNIYCSIDRQSN